MQIDAQIDVGPDRVADGGDALDHRPELGGVRRVVRYIELGRVAQIVDIEFYRRKSIGDHAPSPGSAALGRAGLIVPVAAVGIEPYAVAELAAEQAIERLAGSFGGKVPQGDLDPAQRDQEDARLRAGKDMVAAELFPAIFDIARVLADELLLELRD